MTGPDGYYPRDQWHPTAADRGHHGLDGPACPQRHHLDQHTPPGHRPCQAMCVRCGRVTARRDGDGQPWCGGNPPTTEGGPMRTPREDESATTTG